MNRLATQEAMFALLCVIYLTVSTKFSNKLHCLQTNIPAGTMRCKSVDLPSFKQDMSSKSRLFASGLN